MPRMFSSVLWIALFASGCSNLDGALYRSDDGEDWEPVLEGVENCFWFVDYFEP